MTDSYVVNVDAAVYRLRDGDPEYLLIERGADEDHAAGTMGLPGGTMETSPDDPADLGGAGAIESTLRRELREEVAVEVGEVVVVTSGVFALDTGEPCLNVVCLAEHEAGDPYPAAPDEVAAVDWYTLDRVAGDDGDEADMPGFTRGYVEAAEAARTTDP
ncbi:NUDIX domain-containing protein [Halobaculum magnesiiphilum]|uniref:NUDIX domain-containing protein n=1 Tax=Halobaculum magnesiiphilum TaxID=1017351 RepID=A0A8T8WD13_9EURY|nr:NUDIX domain-containing protein [Halobaculum magnesiiphilum]QZP37653.1 NUDIX domain-containing protein [Halobaculum magnesiiphilum]